jgi:hypothetical protein
MHWWKRRQVMAIEPVTVAELIEAEARSRMAQIARMSVRGFDSQKAKADEIRLLDVVLDAYNEASPH